MERCGCGTWPSCWRKNRPSKLVGAAALISCGGQRGKTVEGMDMFQSKASVFLVVVLALLMAGAAWFFFGRYHVREFSGDGTMSYQGPWYPSYRIAFPPVSLAEPGEHTFSFQGLPSVP